MPEYDIYIRAAMYIIVEAESAEAAEKEAIENLDCYALADGAEAVCMGEVEDE